MSQDGLRKAWEAYIKGGDAPTGVRQGILESWTRCRRAGVDPYQKVVPVIADDKELAWRVRRRSTLIDIALPLMKDLHSLVRGSGFLVVLSDEDGYLLAVVGDEEVADSASRGNFVRGANWSENVAGTNAVGTCLVAGQPLQVVGEEHYCRCSHKWTCSGAVIHDPDGRVIGVLDMTATLDKAHPHTLGMVVAAAHAIEYSLRENRLWEKYRIADEYKMIMLQSMSEGVLAVDEHGVVTQVNNAACRIFRLSSNQIVGNQLQPLLTESPLLADLYSPYVKGRKGKPEITDEEVTLKTPAGKLRCTVSVRPLKGIDDVIVGNVIILREPYRVRQLVHKIAGARARFSFQHLVGKNAAFLRTIEEASVAAQADSIILLLGESGTGKEMFAQAIHNASDRRVGPFVAVNCAALPRELVASELFGYEEGAFTGAKRGGSPGKFELADRGTLFLDEIGDMPMDTQATLLRVLDEKAIMRIGGTEMVPISLGIIAATNKDLPALVREGRFRQDLFYRINAFAIKMIPLRERRNDIPLLVSSFVSRSARNLGKSIDGIHPDAISLLCRYDWPGNVRELQNVCEYAVNLTTDSMILPEAIRLPAQQQIRKQPDAGRPLKNFEKAVILNVIQKHKGNMSKVAKELGISRSTLYRKVAVYDISF